MGVLKMFEEFISLEYKFSNSQVELDNIKERDIKINNIVFIRIRYCGIKVLYINTGSCLFIPIGWIYLFSKFKEYIKNQITYLDKKSSLEKFIVYMTGLNFSNPDKSFLETLGNISELGTEKFINYLKKFNIDLTPFEYNSLNKNIII